MLLGAALVFFMQAGFAMVETGLTRAKNAGNIIMKNLMDFALGTVAFWLAGFGIMFAGDGALIGGFDPFILGDYSSTFPSWAFVIFQTVFCATAATTVTAAPASGPRISKVVILLPQSRFDALKEALSSIGVTGLTVTQVLGCGVQKGQSEFYRGVPMDVTLLPKVKVEVVVSRVPVRSVIDVTKRVLYTGHIGDGKIFVYNVENVVKVRTGEEGVAALQDTH